MTMKNENLLSVKDAAERLGVSVRSVFAYIQQGLLKPVRIGGTKKAGKTYVTTESIEKLLRG
ncbi:MAG: hypothetical protein COT43_06930 [Candidatus Marinimicrobia bacterium CG08_land_8_20_14_0_20_45_22]|nr:MAG: hypothetical protein COT43_06930 [Candidatus Marinimicrobia bacterium CG08_land_8_20_14_0_20_45_22]